MASNSIIKLNNWIDRLLSYPGIDKKEHTLRKSYLISRVACLFGIMILNILIILTNPQIKILIGYGFFLIFIFLEFIAACIFVRRNLEWLMFINQLIIVFGTFFCMIKLGGILNSGGLIFVGFFVVLFSLDFKKNTHSIWIFLAYITTVITAGFLNPYLIVHPEMTTDLNILLFVIILVWISFVALLFVLNFITQYVKIEQLETNRLKDLDDVKSKLYSNITHEFRTPLTIILGMADLIKGNPEEWLDEGIKKIENNSKILLHQVNQMLDLSKLEACAMHVHMVQADIIYYIGYLIELFRTVADSKNIRMQYSPKIESFVMDYDTDKLLQIISNLISNALKYTHPGGFVEIIAAPIHKNGTIFEIRVIDNGQGIEKDHLPYIFDRFYRAENSNIQYPEGSGLGLALTRELVKLLNGTIEVKSMVGTGSEFTFCLPVSNTAGIVEPNEVDKKEIEIPSFIERHYKINLSLKKNIQHPGKPILLIVEDNCDFVCYLQNLLNPEYHIQVATNGKQGLEKAFELIPDIILSDIMMPEMDGIELLEKVKNDNRTSHIPIVLLTAKADIGCRLVGLKRGADAYLAKPFDKEELKIQLNRLVELRKKLQERYAFTRLFRMEKNDDSPIEDFFMKTIQETMEESITEGTFEIKKFCMAVSMSRSQLYRKFKSLTNKTLGEYFKIFRLHKAKELLMKPGSNVSEAAYRTGFKNLSHFSRVFTKEFGINPSEIHR